MKLIIGWLSLLGGFTALAIGAGEDKEAVVPKFGKPLQMMADGKKVGTEAPGYAAPCWHDVDGDGQKDLIVGQFKGGKLRVYKNQGDLILGPGEWLQAGGSPASVPGVWWCTSSTPQFVDIDGDGVTDILSGSYSRKEGEMAGLFFVLRGSQKGFETPQVLKGMDENPLVVTAPGDARDGDLIRICTRPTAVDIDGDGHLDVVSGNMEGTFFVFQGQGKGRFESKSTQLMQGEKALKVSGHSDPFFIDWDRDGDLDLLSGSGVGGVTLFTNLGSSTEPKFGPGVTLLEPQKKIQSVGPVFGHAHVKGPQGSTRVWADDLNGDGKWDLIVGDAVDLHYPADGLTEEEAAEKLGVWETQFAKLNAEIDWESASDEDHQRFEDFYKTREKIVRTDSTGYVWLIYQK